MEADERPSKIRRVMSNDPVADEPESNVLLLSPLSDGIPSPNLVPQSPDLDFQQPAANSPDISELKSTVDVDSDGDSQSKDTSQDTQAPPRLDANGKPLSKSQLKKLRKKEEWEAGRAYRKLKRKEKLQEKKQRKREARDEEAQLRQEPSRQQQGDY